MMTDKSPKTIDLDPSHYRWTDKRKWVAIAGRYVDYDKRHAVFMKLAGVCGVWTFAVIAFNGRFDNFFVFAIWALAPIIALVIAHERMVAWVDPND